MTRHSWLLPLLCFGSAAVTAVLMLSYVWAHNQQTRPSGWVLMTSVAALGVMSGVAYFITARHFGRAIAWGMGVALVSGAFFIAVLTAGFGS